MLLPRHSMWNLPVWIYTGKQWLHSLQKSFCTQFRHFEYILVFSIILISLEPSAWNDWMYFYCYELWLYKCPKYITLAISTEKHGGLQL